MTVLIAAAGDLGVAASDRLRGAGFTVERVETLAEARVRAATVAVAVVGPLADASPADLRDALRETGADTPLVAIDPVSTDGWSETVVETDDLPAAVRIAQHAGDYRDAVDELFERCRNGEEIGAARERADEAFNEVRRAAGRTPFERLLDE